MATLVELGEAEAALRRLVLEEEAAVAAEAAELRTVLENHDALRVCLAAQEAAVASSARDVAEQRDCLDTAHAKVFAELEDIYPIEWWAQASSRGEYAIRGIELPNDLAFVDDDQVAAALGYATHLVLMFAKYMQVPLRFPLVYAASRSLVVDGVSPGQAGSTFPLFRKEVERRLFNRGVRMLEADVEQLLAANGRQYTHAASLLYNLRQLYHPPRRSRHPGLSLAPPRPAPPPKAASSEQRATTTTRDPSSTKEVRFS